MQTLILSLFLNVQNKIYTYDISINSIQKIINIFINI